MRYEAVLFDFGGVVVPGPFDAFTDLERELGVAPGAVREINSRDPDRNAWACIERGELTEDEFVARFEAEARALGHRLDGRRVLDIVAGTAPARESAHPQVLEALGRCRALGLQLGLITNNIRPMTEQWVLDLFDVVVQSCRAGMRKPEAAIYEHAASELGVPLDRCIMLDDLGINLKPARLLGAATVKVGDPAAAVSELYELLGV